MNTEKKSPSPDIISKESTGGCPVKYSSPRNDANETSNTSRSWTSWFRSVAPSAVSPSTKNSITTTDDRNEKALESGFDEEICPVKHSKASSQSSQLQQHELFPKSIEEAARHAQSPQPGQTVPLSTVRTVSSILRTARDGKNESTSNSSTPHHQPSTEEKWVYPSEQQFFNAMRRKGWDLPPGTELTIPHVVQIHNAVNEKGWGDIVKWEKMRGNDNPRLVRFMGRPNDLSPRAWFMSRIRMKKEPFDRHDWFVDRGGSEGDEGQERRYVIDFYGGEERDVASEGLFSKFWNGTDDEKHMTTAHFRKAPSMYLDVRPALDDTDALYDRVAMFMKRSFPGIYETVAPTLGGSTSKTNLTSSTNTTEMQSNNTSSSIAK